MKELTISEVNQVSGGLSSGTIEALEFGVTFAGGLAAAATLAVPLAVGAVAVAGAYGTGWLIGHLYNVLSE